MRQCLPLLWQVELQLKWCQASQKDLQFQFQLRLLAGCLVGGRLSWPKLQKQIQTRLLWEEAILLPSMQGLQEGLAVKNLRTWGSTQMVVELNVA
jgi:hypothetical protein